MQALGPVWQITCRFRLFSWIAVAILAQAIAGIHFVKAAEVRTGESIYRERCARCHGPTGEGTEDYPEPLTGNFSIGELTQFIDESMPEESPEECVGADAARAAAFVFESFYSTQAQIQNQSAARIELSRVTVRQYRNAVADLLATFRPTAPTDDVHGLRASYYNSRRVRGNPDLQRIDSAIQFDFGTDAPEPEGFDPHQFSIRWEGSIIAPETGIYDFFLRTNQSARMWFNTTLQQGPPGDRRSRRRTVELPFIDGFVKSGDDDEYKASIYLLGGRAYPVRVEFSKSKQGVDDSDKNPPKPTNASIELLWRLPKRAAEVIPRRNFLVAMHPEVFVVSTPFPPDDRSVGYERGTSISKAWDEATTAAAIETAGYVVKNIATLAKLNPNLSRAERQPRVVDFCCEFVERAFRRPLAESQREFFVHRQFDTAPDLDTALKRVVLLTLKTPRFLYHDIADDSQEVDPSFVTAARLSFGLWDSLPDRELLAAAEDGKLSSRAEIIAQAERMVRDRRARSKLRAFLMQWLKVEQIPSLVKSETAYPGFDDSIATDLRTSLELTLDAITRSDDSDFRSLFLDQSLFLNGRLAELYGVDLPPDAPFQRVVDAGQRAGVLTHPYLMANFAYTAESSPIHRGVFLARNVLGRALRPPAEAFTPLPADLHPDLTTRERVALQTKPKACLNCHSMINPLGFTLENFDAIGRYREKEGDRAIDATGGYRTANGDSVSFDGVRDLAMFLANDSQEAHRAFVTSLFHYLVKQPIDAFGLEAGAKLRTAFQEGEYSIRQLMVEIMVVAVRER